jgi:hypothetical protein
LPLVAGGDERSGSNVFRSSLVPLFFGVEAIALAAVAVTTEETTWGLWLAAGAAAVAAAVWGTWVGRRRHVVERLQAKLLQP